MRNEEEESQSFDRILGTVLVMIVGALSLTTPAYAQEPRELSVEASLDQALAHNPDLQRADLQIERSQVLVRGEESVLSPVLSFDASYLHNDEPTQGLFENGLRISDIVQFEAQAAKRLKWGTTLSLSLANQRLRSVQPFTLPGGAREVNEIGPQWSGTLTFSVSQPLLKGFGEELNLVSQTAAQQQLEGAELSRVQAVSQVVLDTLDGYYELYYADREIDNRRSQIKLAEDQKEATQALIDAGQLANSELDVIDQRLVLLEEAQLVSESQRDNRVEALMQVLGQERKDTRLLLKPTTDPVAEVLAQSDPELVELGRAQNVDLQLLREQIQGQEIQLVTSRNAILPQLDLNMSVSQRGLSDDGLIDSNQQVFGLEAGSALVALMFSMPLDNGRAEAQYEADRLQLQELEMQYDATARQIDDAIRTAARLVRLNEKRVGLAERTVALSYRTLAAEEARFKAGLSTNQAVVQFQESLEEAQGRQLRSRIDLMLSMLRLRHLTGSLLGTYGIEVNIDG